MTTVDPELWGGDRETGPTQDELAFATALTAALDGTGLDYWMYDDEDGTPWLLVSLSFVEGGAVHATLRLDFDTRGIRGGWSPANLNWDGGARAEEAVDLTGADGIDHPRGTSSLEELAQVAAEWFMGRKERVLV